MTSPDWLEAATARGTVAEDASLLGELVSMKWHLLQQGYLQDELLPAIEPLPAEDKVTCFLALANAHRHYADTIDQAIRNDHRLAKHLPPLR